MLRAGLTEVLVIGMPTRWIRVSTSPIGIPAKPTAAIVGRREHSEDEKGREHDFGQERRPSGVAAGRVVAIAVGAETLYGGS